MKALSYVLLGLVLLLALVGLSCATGQLSRPFIADNLARLIQKAPLAKTKPELSFSEIPSRTKPLSIPTRHGDMACQVYLPPATSGAKPAVYLNLHGGGAVMGHPEQDDPWCRFLAQNAGVVVINADYALSPQHRFPVAAEQAYDALVWMATGTHEWDGQKVCIGGWSAGASLAASACRMALQQGGPQVRLQVLGYPPLDYVTASGKKPLARKRALLPAWLCDVFTAVYIPDPARRQDPVASPAWGRNGEGIQGIAPAVVLTCELDRFRGEGARYAKSLQAAGALVDHYEVPGADHIFNLMGGSREMTETAYRRLAGRVREAVAR